MALTKISRSLLDTGVSDSSDATAITINSSEQVGIGTTSPAALLNLVEDNSRSTKTGNGLGQIHINGGTDLSNGDVSGITFSSNTLTQASAIIGNKITNSGSTLFFGTSNSYASGVTNTSMEINQVGNITKPNNCSFSARHSSTVSNFSTDAYILCPFDTEIYDNGGNLASTGTFTAPVTGRYLLLATVRFGTVDASATYSRIIINTSNRNYQGTLLDHSTVFSGDSDYHIYFAHFIADMDANDTAEVKYYQLGGAAQADMAGDESFFQGELIG